MAAMQHAQREVRERAIVESVIKLEEIPQALEGLQFWYRPPDRLDAVKVEFIGSGEEGGGSRVRRVGGEEIFDKVRPDQLSIGRGRKVDEPLMRLLDRHGFDPGAVYSIGGV
jgi:hypothetical protein